MWTIRPTEAWNAGSIVGAIVIAVVAAAVIWILARKSAGE
jgi:hypothetical protein